MKEHEANSSSLPSSCANDAAAGGGGLPSFLDITGEQWRCRGEDAGGGDRGELG